MRLACHCYLCAPALPPNSFFWDPLPRPLPYISENSRPKPDVWLSGCPWPLHLLSMPCPTQVVAPSQAAAELNLTLPTKTYASSVLKIDRMASDCSVVSHEPIVFTLYTTDLSLQVCSLICGESSPTLLPCLHHPYESLFCHHNLLHTKEEH